MHGHHQLAGKWQGTKGTIMKQTDQSAAFADFLSKTYISDDERAAFERDLAKLVASAKLLKQLEDIREAKQLTKADIARRLGVTRPVVSRLLAGKGVPNLGTIADVAEALDVYIDVRVKPQPRNGKRHAAIEVHEAAA
jgi:DNA-binding phage protein